jgi:hypothetical protein
MSKIILGAGIDEKLSALKRIDNHFPVKLDDEDTPEIMAEFYFFSYDNNYFDPDVITKKLGIIPSKVTCRGEEIETSIQEIPRKATHWELHTEYERSFDVNFELEKIIDILEPVKEKIIEIEKQLSVTCRFCFVVNMYCDFKPSLGLSKETIHFLSDINAETDYDMYNLFDHS